MQEEKLEDEHIEQGAAKSSDDKSFDKGNIAPAPGGQSSEMPDPKKQEHGDAEYWLMQPVYSKEYTESVKPRHIQPEKVASVDDAHVHCPCIMFPVVHLQRFTGTAHFTVALYRRLKLSPMW